MKQKQYAKVNPRPTTFTEIVKWENTRGFYVDHEVTEQIVLQFRALDSYAQHKKTRYSFLLLLF